jgi:hypothetical protein
MRNNSSPIDRIQDLVTDYHELEQYVEALEMQILQDHPEGFGTLGIRQRPLSRAVIHEEQREKIYGKVRRRNRNYMRAMRSGETPTSIPDRLRIAKEREREPIQPKTTITHVLPVTEKSSHQIDNFTQKNLTAMANAEEPDGSPGRLPGEDDATYHQRLNDWHEVQRRNFDARKVDRDLAPGKLKL